MPKKVIVAPITYVVERRPLKFMEKQDYVGDLVYGVTDPTEAVIAIDPRLSGVRAAEVLTHECAHAISINTGILRDLNDPRQDPDEESIIARFAPAWLLLVRDNPKLVEYWQDPD